MKTAFITLVTPIVLLLTVMAPVTHAVTITVTSTANSGAGTLRNALASVANGDTINFAVTGSITLITGELLVSNSVDILGPGPGSLAVNGNAASRVFHITNSVTAVIAGLTITNGAVTGSFPGGVGGGIWNDHSTLTMSNCAIASNSGGNGPGAGIYNDGSSGSAKLSIIASTVSGNTAFNNGGGIFNEGSSGNATISVSASTFSGNSTAGAGSVGGGIFNHGNAGRAILSVSNSTFSGNLAVQNGGGIYNGGAVSGTGVVTVIASTFNGNTAANSGGGSIYNNGSGAKLEIGDTILKITSALTANIVNAAGTVVSDGYNLSSDSGGGVLTNATDQINTDPMLGPLANNGGPSFTHALLPGSPAIDRGKSFGLTTDQRGLPRPVDDPCLANATGGDGSDIGAFEVQEVCTVFRITAITRESNNVRITWMTPGGKTNALERTSGVAGNFATNNFTAIFTVTNTVGSVTNYLDLGAATNFPARYYRVRLVP